MLLFSGCQPKPKDFTALSFNVESIGNYKFSIEIREDKSYHIRQQNIFFDTFAGREQINTAEGQMSVEEYDRLSELVARSRLFRMKDEYGFDKIPDPDNPLDGLIYQLVYTEGKKIKYISIRVISTDRYPDNFLQLLRFLSNYISEHSPETDGQKERMM